MANIKENTLALLRELYIRIDGKFQDQFGFRMGQMTFDGVTNYLHLPKDSSSLAVTRFLFGLCMLFDIPDERGGALMDTRWGDPRTCHYPLLPFLHAMPMPYMAVVYAAMWFGALGIMLGYKYRISSTVYTACHWYILLADKSYWNNHSYLFGLVALLLSFTQAHCFWSVDSYLDPSVTSEIVPYWNYFILKYQFFILYFVAGLKKGTAEWLTGYSVLGLADHWVFAPFRLFLTVAQVDYLIVHWFIFIFDLTIAFWMMWARTRHVAMLFCAAFHLMNSRLFRIGMFPWVCLATMPLFYPFDWPKKAKPYLVEQFEKVKKLIHSLPSAFEEKRDCCSKNDDFNEATDDDDNCRYNDSEVKDNKEDDDLSAFQETVDEGHIKVKSHLVQTNKAHSDCNIYSVTKGQLDDKSDTKIRKKLNESKLQTTKRFRTFVIILYMTLQLFLPFSHFITKGYNNWTDGLYGYSWDMMVHSWDVHSVVVKVVDNESKKEFYVDPHYFNPNERWTRHGDMVHQYARCLKRNLLAKSKSKLSGDLSIYVDIWCSLNERFIQRMFDPHIDLLNVSWSPLRTIPFLMPMLDEASEWRSVLDGIRSDVNSWNDYSDVVFFADFPGYNLEKYIPPEITNVTLVLLNGSAVYEPQTLQLQDGQSHILYSGERIKVVSGAIHRVFNIGKTPVFYMYTFFNHNSSNTYINKNLKGNPKLMLPIFDEFMKRLRDMVTFANILHKTIILDAINQ